MPELPEVETIRRDLEPLVVGRRVVRIELDRSDSRYSGIDLVRRRAIRSLTRRGKYLVLSLGPTELIIHLGMSGRLFATRSEQNVEHRRVVLALSGEMALVFVDQRRFGVMRVVPAGDYRTLPTLLTMGPEPLSADFDIERFAGATSDARRAIKPLLLGQRLVAGLGNIYVDEVLHAARINPATRGLDREPALRLHRAIRRVLAAAIARRGTTFSLYRDGLLREGDYLLQVPPRL